MFLIVELESLPADTAGCPANGNPNGKIDVFHINVHRNGDFSLIHWILKKKNEDLNLSGVRERLVEGKLQIPFGSGVWGPFLQERKPSRNEVV